MPVKVGPESEPEFESSKQESVDSSEWASQVFQSSLNVSSNLYYKLRYRYCTVVLEDLHGLHGRACCMA
jgi:hypothetical protein